MVKRNEPAKQISMSLDTFNEFMGFQEYNETKEGILKKIMVMAHKYKAFSIHHKHKESDV